MKRILIIAAVFCLLLSFIGCGAEPMKPETADSSQLAAKQAEYASLLVEKGVGLHEGQKLMILAEAECYEFARLCEEAAYKAGASDVILQWEDAGSDRLKFLYADDSAFESYPSYLNTLYSQCLEENIPVLKLHSVHPGLLSDVDPALVARGAVTPGDGYQGYNNARLNNDIAWSIGSVPNETWAKTVFPDLPADEALSKLWDTVLQTVYVSGSGDSADVWREHLDRLSENAAKLNEAHFRTLHYTNSLGTDFTIDLHEKALWCCAYSVTPDGSHFTPNMPTEEIFTAPVAGSANGVIYASLPLELDGNVIENIKFTVKDGRIVDSYASSGLEILNSKLDADEGARYFGEISLVPYDSPISRLGILFYDTLFDENASCHIAFGAAYSECIEGGVTMSEEDLAEAGMNSSVTHIDFMVGTEDLKITGTTYDGREITVFENGVFSGYFS